jgi:hypothetical protein
MCKLAVGLRNMAQGTRIVDVVSLFELLYLRFVTHIKLHA